MAWRGASLEGCDFRDADLRGADLRGADLFGARFHGTDLRRTLLDMNRIVEVWIPRDLPLPIVNQIRQFDFRHVMARYVGPNRAHDPLDCPYGDAAMKPILYEWGSRTWNQGAGWNPPEDDWDLEEIIGAVLDHLACRHDLRRPYPTSSSTTARDA